MKFMFLVVFFILVINQPGFAIRITRFVVPSVASYGATLDLDCAYDLEHDQLYDVKWYKDNYEFFRCKSDGEVQPFVVDGIQLYHNERATLGSCPVSVTVVHSNAAGQYRCEVSTEAPAFRTTAKSAVLRISNIKPSKRVQDDAIPTSATSSLSHESSGAASRDVIFNAISLIFVFVIYIV